MTKERQWQPNFDGNLGLKQGYAITNMPPSSCLDIKNMYLNGLGGKAPRAGYLELFHTTEQRLTTGTVTPVTGAPAVGATLLQAVSGAVGVVMEIGSGYFVIEGVVGTFDYSHTVTGTNLNATTFTFTPTALTTHRLTNRVSSLLQYSPQGGTVRELAFSGTKIFVRNGTTSGVLRSGLTNNKAWEWIQYRDKVLGVNGSNSSFLYSGSLPSVASPVVYTTISVNPPSANVTYSDVGGGGLTAGNYQYLVTFYDNNTGRESNPALYPATAPLILAVGGAGKVTITTFPTPVSGEGVTHFRIYRKRGSETVFTRLTTLPISTTTYDDNDNVTGSIAMEYDTGQPDEGNTPHPASDLICEAFDRVFMVDPNDPSILVYSRKGIYHAFPSANYFFVGRGDGSRIVRIEKHGKALLIHKKNSWYLLPDDPDTAVPEQLSKVGTQDFRASISAHNQVLRLTTTGFYRAVPTEYSTTDLREDYIGQDIATYEENFDWANSQYLNCYNYNSFNRRHVYFILPALSQSGTTLYYSHCWVFDIVLSQWVYYEIGSDVYSVSDYWSDNKKYMMFGDGYGIVWQWDIGDSDGSSLPSALLNGTMTSGGTTFQDTDKIDVSSTATAGGVNTLQDSTQSWDVNEWVAKPVYIVSGTGAGQSNVVASNTSTTLTCTTNWTTPPDNTSVYTIGGWAVNELIGCVVSTWEGNGALQKRRVISNTSYTITVDSAWTVPVSINTTYSVAAIEQFAEEYWDSNGAPQLLKRMRWVIPYVRQTGNYDVEISFRKDFSQTYSQEKSMNLSSAVSTWGVFLWDSGSWGGRTSNLKRINLHGKYHYYSIRYRNANAAEPLYWDGHGVMFQVLPDRYR